MEENQVMFDNAKETAGKAVGRFGLLTIVVIVAMGVGASLVLDETKMAAVMGLLGASLTALIAMMNNVVGETPEKAKPEFELMGELVDRLGKQDLPMNVTVADGKVVVTKGADTTELKNGA